MDRPVDALPDAALPEEVRRRLGGGSVELTRLGASRVLRGAGCVVKVGPPRRIARETYVLRDLRGRLPLAVPEVLDAGDGWMVLADLGPDDPPADWSPAPIRDLAAMHLAFAGDPAVDHAALADPFGAAGAGAGAEAGDGDGVGAEAGDGVGAGVTGAELPEPLATLRADPSPLRAAIAGQPATLVHGDAWRGNLLWRAGRPYWLDWEEASRAPAVADLATWLYGTPFVPPTPTPDADLAAYQEVSGPVDRVALDAAFLLLFLTLDVPVLGEIRDPHRLVADRAAHATRWLDQARPE